MAKSPLLISKSSVPPARQISFTLPLLLKPISFDSHQSEIDSLAESACQKHLSENWPEFVATQNDATAAGNEATLRCCKNTRRHERTVAQYQNGDGMF